MKSGPHLSLRNLHLGAAQVHGGLTVLPILGEDLGPDYLPLGAALAEDLVRVEEHGPGGRVPELLVHNRAQTCVLILDGEQLVGAKQNRAVNTTILLAPRSRTVIPVSCVEQGRWHRRSGHFADGAAVLPRALRAAKSAAVHDSLRRARSHRGDQGAVWEGVALLLGEHGVDSPTQDLDAVYRARAGTLGEWLGAFGCLAGQRGVVVGLGDEVVALELLSRPSAWARVHERILKSYVAEALSPMAPGEAAVDDASARTFLEEIAAADLEVHPAVGLGRELRVDETAVVGCALVAEDVVVHGAFLRPGETPRFKDFLL